MGTLINHINGFNKPLCPQPAYMSLFYHLGYVHGDSVLLRHGAQDIFVRLLATLKLAEYVGSPASGNKISCKWGGDIEISCEWDGDLHMYAPSLHDVISSAETDGQSTMGFRLDSEKDDGGVCDPRKRAVVGEARGSSDYKVGAATLRALAPLLQHLLALSFYLKDNIAGREAAAKLCRMLGVERVGMN